MARVYDKFGGSYAQTRRSDPRIAAAIWSTLGDATSVVNVGAGAGSYEPRDRVVVAVEPSEVMIGQRPPGSNPVVRAAAEALPFRDTSFEAALAVLTIHHWADRRAGLAELRRVASRVVIFTWDPAYGRNGYPFWLTKEYFPAMSSLDKERFPTLGELAAVLGPLDARPVPVPRDCQDGFGGAFWARPEAYLDPVVRSGMSSFAAADPEVVDELVRRLAADLESGEWDARYGALRHLPEIDLGYRLVVAERR